MTRSLFPVLACLALAGTAYTLAQNPAGGNQPNFVRQRYEYLSVWETTIDKADGERKDKTTAERRTEYLSKLGAEGWELTHITFDSGGSPSVYFLKRPK